MKIEKLSLKGIKNVLSRAEMKNIMAGSGSGGGYYQCCPGPGNGTIGCSNCVYVPSGSTATCTLGTLTKC